MSAIFFMYLGDRWIKIYYVGDYTVAVMILGRATREDIRKE